MFSIKVTYLVQLVQTSVHIVKAFCHSKTIANLHTVRASELYKYKFSIT